MRPRTSLLVLALAAGAWPARAHAQDWLVLQGIAETEAWASDSGSRLLTRNAGKPGVVGRLRVFTGLAPSRAFQVIALTELEGGNAYTRNEHVTLEALVARAVASPALILEAGRIPSPVGAFAPRRLAPVNPLIGEPDAYPTRYPWGAQVSGKVTLLDYRLALVDLAPVHDGYSPPPGSSWRGVIGAGVTPFIGAHFGGTYTRGPYLGGSVITALQPGVDWKSFTQEIFALDGRVSRGYVDLHAEWARSTHEVPTVGTIPGVAWYAELKYTWTPRFFTAGRFQQNDYPFIRPINANRWIGARANFYAGEVGVGWRMARGVLLKVSYQKDRWDAPQLSGQAVAVQVSWQFDATEWVQRKQ